ncbi:MULTISPECIES: nicotinate-nucleotide adenylyltransferase [Aneurinibacillus]|uniref:Probable nicotinate-nucleotide adenylyltransferase n=1 Tax=Aneurinibacillus thermoaerophilus TaxID=143495 RepID=A0A1G7Z845_ANETH|nr:MULTISPECIES: nicotinate-nucleotide adenylyltransferase [Aneurinibacillus]AMA72303.1 nicotinate-nicotinamide nucleotide adenylyltransferase [Aneurinibacillus sp. XH2]MED0674846.1 nicotinate-nucleotide adenylyltransferase [Aneurinibacillus thermoaerophilus]MED0679796.1 nicotinate-nucleotide adenylyltransferase [Aneurinibacillus thermoaerophilus]MED0735828.1 nicotinate-nucleotide adenylyltransferase [Aneurinibacillus thermoaerophilus]MED0758502.1 nicotinate-nucleotide adenylyltransferase [Ane
MNFRNKRKKVAIYGGTFDPIHAVHLIVAEQARDALGLDEVWFMPARLPPHKLGNPITEDKHRVAMVELAIADNPYFSLSTVELEMECSQPSYTYHTVRLLKERHPDTEFYFIIGGDMAKHLPKWYKIEELITMVKFVVLARPGYIMDNKYMQDVIQVRMPQLDVSSTMIRQKAADGKSIRYLVPEAVRLYIEEKRLYEA